MKLNILTVIKFIIGFCLENILSLIYYKLEKTTTVKYKKENSFK